MIALFRQSKIALFSFLLLITTSTFSVSFADAPQSRLKENLDLYRAELQTLADKGQIVGAVTLTAQNGRIISLDPVGRRTLNEPNVMTQDTIFRIASMTKPITGVALMMLYEEGRWSFDDPVSRFIPELAKLDVVGADGKRRPAQSVMTMRHLITHTAGFVYGLTDGSPVDALYRESGVLHDDDWSTTLEKISKLPLAFEPGSTWYYSIAVDLQGLIVERLSGQNLSDFFADRIFKPLGMKDTGFWVPVEKLPRLAGITTHGLDNKLVPGQTLDILPVKDPTQRPKLFSGGAGLYSTAGDYFRFAQMLLNGGSLDGAQILKPETVKLIHSAQTPTGVQEPRGMLNGLEFGVDVAIVRDPLQSPFKYAPGSYFWGGAYGTWFWIDPANTVVVVGMQQHLDNPQTGHDSLSTLSTNAVYKALAVKR